MDSAGRLAGGIAHDFNNYLTSMIINTELALMTLPHDHPAREHLVEIQKASEQAAELTDELLSFSRRQVMEPVVLSLNNLITGMEGYLRDLVDDTVELVTLLDPDLKDVKLDPVRFGRVIVNLAENARHAMPEGGKLTITTANQQIGEGPPPHGPGAAESAYVKVTIHDTGKAVSEEVMAHIFEPFFSTREHGQRNGLRLSTCYGIVKQHQGEILVQSKPGEGTTFKIYLPQLKQEGRIPESTEAAKGPSTGETTVLLVEDEPSIRLMTTRILRTEGYTVLEAANGDEALQVAAANAGQSIHLLLSDLVMPVMAGKELADRLLSLHPETRVLFTSGYPDETIVDSGGRKPGVQFIQKPFTPVTLVLKVREVLNQEE